MTIAMQYIHCFRQYLNRPQDPFHIFYQSNGVLKALCGGLENIRTVGETGKQTESYDLELHINRVAQILRANQTKIHKLAPHILPLLTSYKKFCQTNQLLITESPWLDGQINHLCEIKGQKRIQQADVDGRLNIPVEFIAPIPLENKTQTLAKFGLSGKKFITLSRGTGKNSDASHATSNKQWPMEYYQTLARMIKTRFPQFTLVQLEAVRECTPLVAADADLRGKTTLEECKVILKNAALHIDSEGGLVHLRHALHGGPSAVLFGPTSPRTYGYPENLNLRSGACPTACEWLVTDWLTRCPNRRTPNVCMKTLTPYKVMEKLSPVLEELAARARPAGQTD